MTYQEPGAGSQQIPPAYAQPQQPQNPYNQPTQTPKPGRNVLALVALITSVVGFIFACIPGALIVGWILLPIAFVLAIVSLFLKGSGKGLGIAGLIISVVGTIVAFVVFFAVVATSFSDAFGDSTVAVEEQAESSQAPAEEAAPAEAPATEAGSRENPVAVGSTITGDKWTIVINSFNPDGTAAVAEANQFNEAAPAGSHYGIINYTVTYTGADSSYAAEVGVDYVTAAGNVVNTYDNFVVLTDAIGLDELFTGASATGSAAFVVPDGDTGLIRVRPGMLADDIFVQP
jgi:hypothetical protein